METFLEEHLKAISWPRETNVTFQIDNDGGKAVLDVDLPEVEQMPTTMYTPAARGYRLLVKKLSGNRLQQAYMDHVHGIGFRIIGEAFAALPKCSEVVVSAYSQRPDSKTGHTRDEYLYSVRVLRPQWETLNFGALRRINVVDALACFELKRDMSKNGTFRAIAPLT